MNLAKWRVLGATLALALPTSSPPLARAADLILKNVVIHDGTGKKGFPGDVRIRGDRIIEVAAHLKPSADDVVRDEHGLALAPGFIDMHSHADELILQDLDAENVTRQGVTTVVVGQDGGSMYPLADFLGKLESAHAALNVASMVGHGTLRLQGMDQTNPLRAATPEELAKMKQLLAQELKAGGFGLSSGLEYDPGHYATTEELIELSKIAAADGGFYISHVRDEGKAVFDSFNEVLQIGGGAHLPVEITHIKLATPAVWHATSRVKALFEQARKQGVTLRADVYPYTFWESLARVILLDRDYANPEKMSKAIADNGGPDHLRFTSYTPDPSIVGKTLTEVANAWQIKPVEAYIKIIRETLDSKDEASIMGESMIEDDVRWFIAQPQITFCSDGGLHDQHPRGAGSFPRILGHYVREEKVLPLELAIHKMTGLSAEHLGLRDRGRIAPGFIADLVLFDQATVVDGSRVGNSEAPPKGIPAVMVSGTWVVEDGKVTGAHPGRVLRHSPVGR
jgi:N-acyl-D-amino-acid deacylase